MQRRRLQPSRGITSVPALLAVLFIAACEGSHQSPTAVPSPPSIPPTGNASFYGDATVESVTGQSPCGMGEPRPGDYTDGMRWDEVRVVVQDSTFLIAYDEMWVNGPNSPRYSGTLDGRRFADDFHVTGDYLSENCQFRESSISGAFSEDFRSFELHETMIWGPPSRELRVVTLHRAARR